MKLATNPLKQNYNPGSDTKHSVRDEEGKKKARKRRREEIKDWKRELCVLIRDGGLSFLWVTPEQECEEMGGVWVRPVQTR